MTQVNVPLKSESFWQGSDFLQGWLKRHLPDKKVNWILAISGGIDSMGLLLAFIELRKKKSPYLPDKLIVAHLDHGWREESARQAQALKVFVESHKLPSRERSEPDLSKQAFSKADLSRQELSESVGGEREKSKQGSFGTDLVFVSRRLEAQDELSGNLEAEARQARYAFFEEVALEHQAPFVFLAHQASDRRETLLKNILEGKELAFLHGMKEITRLGTLTLLRPWLSVEKEWIQQELVRSNISWFEDATNQNMRFLRARMREKIFPVLDENWPKSWRKGLDQIANYSEELARELDEHIAIDTTRPEPAIGGWICTLPLLERAYAWRHYLRIASSSIEPLDRSGAERLAEAIEKRARTSFRSKRYLWQLHYPYLIALDVEASIEKDHGWQEPFQSPKEGEVVRWGPWEVACLEKSAVESRKLTLKDYWMGQFFTPCLKGDPWVHLELVEDRSLRSKILRHMQRRHIPASIREWMPLAAQKPENLLWRGSCLRDEAFVLAWSWKAPSHP